MSASNSRCKRAKNCKRIAGNVKSSNYYRRRRVEVKPKRSQSLQDCTEALQWSCATAIITCLAGFARKWLHISQTASCLISCAQSDRSTHPIHGSSVSLSVCLPACHTKFNREWILSDCIQKFPFKDQQVFYSKLFKLIDHMYNGDKKTNILYLQTHT